MVSRVLSKLRRVVLTQLFKAWKLDVDVPVSRLIRVFNLNSALVYKFLRELQTRRIVEMSGKGKYRLRDCEETRALSGYVSTLLDSGWYEYFSKNVPEIYYYVADLPLTWFGFREKIPVIVDEVLRGKINPPLEYRVIYVSMRGKKWRYSDDLKASVASWEQVIADLLSYDPHYPIEEFLHEYMGRVDLDRVAAKCTPKGLRRLSTFLAFYRMVTGKLMPTRFNYVSLIDEEVLSSKLSEYSRILFANDLDVRRRL